MRGWTRHVAIKQILFVFTFSSIALVLSGCKLNLNDEVQGLASSKARTVAAATVTPGAGSDYAFTIENQPSIEITRPVSGSEAFYSIDGGPYQRYTGPFTLPIADPKADQTITVSAYVSHPEYRDSAPVSQTYRFVATTVPAPTITIKQSSYYRYDAPPTVSASCSLSGATLWYSVDGAPYTKYTGSFPVPVPAVKSDWNVNRDVTITMYASATGYIDSAAASTQALHFYGQYAIVTIAGTGVPGSTGDGGDARLALLNQPQGVCVDSEKNVYIAESAGHCVRKVNASDGTITTIAGTGGTSGESGDDGPAQSAMLNKPISLAIDTANNVLYIADSGNYRVRALSLSNGTITRFVGASIGGSSDDGTPRLSGNIIPFAVWFGSRDGVATLFIADRSGQKVWYVDADSAVDSPLHVIAGGGGITYPDGVPALSALLIAPSGICADSSNLYIADNYGYRVYRVDFSTLTIHTVCTDLSAQPFQPCMDDSTLYFTESPGNRIQRYASSSLTLVTGMAAGTAATLADEVDGALPNTTPTLNTPMGMFLVPHDGLYVADRGNNRVRKIILY